MAYSSIKLYKEKFVVIYYQHESILRHRTGITVLNKDFDKRYQKIKPTDLEHESKNLKIEHEYKLVEQIIETYFKSNGIKPTGEYVKKNLIQGITLLREKSNLELTECFNDFLQEMTIHFNNPDLSVTSLKDFRSTYNSLLDYKAIKGGFELKSINEKRWLEEYNQFLAKKRPSIEGYKFKSDKQNDKTRAKRFHCLKRFGRWLEEKELIKGIKNLEAFKIKVVKKNYFSLNLGELRLIQNNNFPKKQQSLAIDMFIFACHTGLRYGDVIRVKKSMIINDANGLKILKMFNQKTDELVEVPLSNYALQILIRNDYQFKNYPKVNKFLHEALATIEDFRVEYRFGTDGDTKPKFELIKFHTARRSFVTNLVNSNINLNAIMKMTGHKKISTLQEYINTDYTLITENIKIFNEI